MKKYTVGMWAPQGFYFEKGTWKTLAVPRRGKILKGIKDSTFIRLPVSPILMPFLGPFLGGLYVVLFPVIAVAILLWLVAARAWKLLLAPIFRHIGGDGRTRSPLRRWDE
jgi:hypothetical protein